MGHLAEKRLAAVVFRNSTLTRRPDAQDVTRRSHAVDIRMSAPSPTAPLIVSAPPRFAAVRPIGRRQYLRVDGFLTPDAAEAVYEELSADDNFERLNAARSGSPSLRSFGALQLREGRRAAEPIQSCFVLFTHPWFEDLISRLVGEQVRCLRPPRAYRLSRGDRLEVHDDLFDHRHRASVVLSFAKGWRRSYGGNTLVGRVARVEESRGSSAINCRWVLSRSNTLLTPRFNSLIIIPLRPELAHAVTTVKANLPRISIASIYGRLHAQ